MLVSVGLKLKTDQLFFFLSLRSMGDGLKKHTERDANVLIISLSASSGWLELCFSETEL